MKPNKIYYIKIGTDEGEKLIKDLDLNIEESTTLVLKDGENELIEVVVS